jgi:type II secretory pathway pseudopilin PulG
MIRASALYISLIVSILIVLVCGSMLLIGFTYRMQERKQERMQLLRENVASAMLILMQQDFKTDTVQQLSLYGKERDSVSLEKKSWGIYELGLTASWINGDTLRKAFLIGTPLTDSLKVLYLADEDRPMSITGKSLIKGTAYLPKSGIKAAYVESSGYADKTLVYGAMRDSERDMPAPDADLLKSLEDLLAFESDTDRLPDTIENSFFNPVKRLHLEKDDVFLSGFKAKGNVVISSDSMLVIDKDCRLDGVILVAPYVKIEDSFSGKLQVIATDSISVGNEVRLSYPSALLVMKNDTAKHQVKIVVGKKSVIEGQLFAWEKERSVLMPLVQIGEETVVKGEVWSKGYVALSKTAKVNGSVSAIRLMARVASAIYENYLIDVKLDKTVLPKYYLSSGLLNKQKKSGRLLCWVN